jgi:hypothetical protein
MLEYCSGTQTTWYCWRNAYQVRLSSFIRKLNTPFRAELKVQEGLILSTRVAKAYMETLGTRDKFKLWWLSEYIVRRPVTRRVLSQRPFRHEHIDWRSCASCVWPKQTLTYLCHPARTILETMKYRMRYVYGFQHALPYLPTSCGDCW